MEASGNKTNTSPRVIVVFGATGQQGGSVAHALIKDGTFKVRAVTRNKDSEEAVTLRKQGADVVTADFYDLESVQKATEGAYGVFAVTAYWGTFIKEKEVQQGKNVADACKVNGVPHLIFSTQASPEKEIGIECAHMDSKVEIEEYMHSLDLPMTSVHYPFYFENFFSVMKPVKNDDGTYTLDEG